MEIPIGFRFQPNDREIITDYLRPMVEKRPPQCEDVILIRDLYGAEASDISLIFEAATRTSKYYDNEEDVLYFYTPLTKKYGKGTRILRVAGNGSWTLQDKGKTIYDRERRAIGLKKHLSFTTNEQEVDAPAAAKKRKASSTNNISWIMHEYSLMPASSSAANQETEYVICKIRRKGAASSHSSSRRFAFEEDVVGPVPVPANNFAAHAMMVNTQPIPSVISPMLGHQYYNPSFNHMPAMVEGLVPAVPTSMAPAPGFINWPPIDQTVMAPMVVDQQYYNHMPATMPTIMNDASLVPSTSTIFASSTDTQADDDQTKPEELDEDLHQFCNSLEENFDEEDNAQPMSVYNSTTTALPDQCTETNYSSNFDSSALAFSTDTQTDDQAKLVEFDDDLFGELDDNLLEELDDDLLQLLNSIEVNPDEGNNAQPMSVYSSSTTALHDPCRQTNYSSSFDSSTFSFEDFVI